MNYTKRTIRRLKQTERETLQSAAVATLTGRPRMAQYYREVASLSRRDAVELRRAGR
jgi:hypothetical protein